MGFLVRIIADADIVVRLLFGVGEARLVGAAGIGGACPTVRVDGDRDGNRRHRQRAGHISDVVVVIALGPFDHSVLRRRAAGAHVRLAAGIGDVRQRVAFCKTIYGCKIVFPLADECLAVILLLLVVGRNRQLLAVVDLDRQFASVVDHVARDGTAVARQGMIVGPAVDAGRRHLVSVADFQLLRLFRLAFDRIAVHIEVLDMEGRHDKLAVIEGDDIVFGIGGDGQALQILVRIVIVIRVVGIAVVPHPGLVDRCSLLLHGDGGAVHVVYDLIRVHLDVFVPVEHVADGVADLVRLLAVQEGQDVVFIIQCQRLGAGVRPVTRDGDCVLADLLAHRKDRARDRLLRVHFALILGIQIADRVAERGQGPAGVQRDVPRNRRGEVVALRRVLIRVPAREGIVLPLRCIRVFRDLVLFNRLRVDAAAAAVHVEGDGIGRRRPLAVDRQIGRGHLGKVVRRGQAGVRVPAAPRIVLVHAALRRSRRPVIRAAADIRVELDLLKGLKLRSTIIVVDLIGVAVIVKVISCYVIFIVTMVKGIAVNYLRRYAVAVRIVSLAVFF